MEYEPASGETVSMAVLRAVSAIEGREPLDLPPLAGVLDPDALDMLFATYGDAEQPQSGRISFEFSKSRVTVDCGETLTVRAVCEPQPNVSGHAGNSEG